MRLKALLTCTSIFLLAGCASIDTSKDAALSYVPTNARQILPGKSPIFYCDVRKEGSGKNSLFRSTIKKNNGVYVDASGPEKYTFIVSVEAGRYKLNRGMKRFEKKMEPGKCYELVYNISDSEKYWKPYFPKNNHASRKLGMGGDYNHSKLIKHLELVESDECPSWFK